MFQFAGSLLLHFMGRDNNANYFKGLENSKTVTKISYKAA